MKRDISWTELPFGTVMGKIARRKLYGVDSWSVRCKVCGTVFKATLAHALKSQGACGQHEEAHNAVPA